MVSVRTIITSFVSPPVEECLDCRGNFKFLQHLGKRITSVGFYLCVQVAYETILYFFAAIPVFPRPTENDRPINPINSPLQFNGTGKYWNLDSKIYPQKEATL